MAALQQSEPDGGLHTFDIILAFRFTLKMLVSLIQDCPPELMARAGRIDSLFVPILEGFPPLDIWFSPPLPPLISSVDAGEAEGGGKGGEGKSQAAGPKSSATKVQPHMRCIQHRELSNIIRPCGMRASKMRTNSPQP